MRGPPSPPPCATPRDPLGGRRPGHALRLLVLVLGALMPSVLDAQASFEAVSVTTGDDGDQTYSLSIQLLMLMTALTVLPAAVITMTAFTRIIIVLAILRQALGTAQTPSSQILVGLAMFLTLFVMTPVLDRINDVALQPYLQHQIEFKEGVERAMSPVREFMLAQTRATDLDMFAELSASRAGPAQSAPTAPAAQSADPPLLVLIPAFVTSELKTAFQIGFLVFIPFLVIDLVVASVLMSMGMMMLSPLIISFPFKIMLFVLVDGWALIVGTLASSFYV